MAWIHIEVLYPQVEGHEDSRVGDYEEAPITINTNNIVSVEHVGRDGWGRDGLFEFWGEEIKMTNGDVYITKWQYCYRSEKLSDLYHLKDLPVQPK